MGGKSNEPAGTIDTTGQTSQRDTGRTSTSQDATIPAFLRPFLRQGTSTASGGLDQLRRLSRGDLAADFNPDQTQAFDLARGFSTSDPFTSALNAFSETARGDFLFGGDGFNAAVDAAVRSAQPHILSTFGAGNRGTGGLAQTAIAQSATDAFARQFGDERGRQLQAASALPQLGLLPIDTLLRTGGAQQQQAQREIDAPLDAQRSLISAALAGLPIESLFGFSQTGTQSGTTRGTSASQQPFFENEGANILGGALSGLGLGSELAPLLGLGAGPLGIAGALGGGLLGLL